MTTHSSMTTIVIDMTNMYEIKQNWLSSGGVATKIGVKAMHRFSTEELTIAFWQLNQLCECEYGLSVHSLLTKPDLTDGKNRAAACASDRSSA